MSETHRWVTVEAANQLSFQQFKENQGLEARVAEREGFAPGIFVRREQG
jgi:hypothetical protein